MESPEKYSEIGVIFMKILGGIAVVLSFRWLVSIFKGKDGHLDKKELREIIALIFFVSAGTYMIIIEGTRTHEWHVYSEWYVAIVFGALLTVLHLDAALDKILKLMEALIKLRKGGTVTEQSAQGDAQVH